MLMLNVCVIVVAHGQYRIANRRVMVIYKNKTRSKSDIEQNFLFKLEHRILNKLHESRLDKLYTLHLVLARNVLVRPVRPYSRTQQ